MEKPEFVTDEHLDYLDKAQRSNLIPMSYAAEYLPPNFPELSKQDAREVLKYWMNTFSERQEQVTNE